MFDKWSRVSSGLKDPISRWEDVVSDDDNNLPERPRAIHVAGGGNVSMVDSSGNTAVFLFGDGDEMLIRPVRINETNTTATGIVALY